MCGSPARLRIRIPPLHLLPKSGHRDFLFRYKCPVEIARATTRSRVRRPILQVTDGAIACPPRGFRGFPGGPSVQRPIVSSHSLFVSRDHATHKRLIGHNLREYPQMPKTARNFYQRANLRGGTEPTRRGGRAPEQLRKEMQEPGRQSERKGKTEQTHAHLAVPEGGPCKFQKVPHRATGTTDRPLESYPAPPGPNHRKCPSSPKPGSSPPRPNAVRRTLPPPFATSRAPYRATLKV